MKSQDFTKCLLLAHFSWAFAAGVQISPRGASCTWHGGEMLKGSPSELSDGTAVWAYLNNMAFNAVLSLEIEMCTQEQKCG